MQNATGKFVVSPSDLNHFLECEHLVQLDRARHPRAPSRPSARRACGAAGAKGAEHETALARALSRRRPSRRRDRRTMPATGTGKRDAGRTLDAMRAGADVIYQGVFVDGRLARYQPTSSCAWTRRRPGRLELRGMGHEARTAQQAVLRPAALLLHRAARRAAGTRRRRRCTSFSAPASRAPAVRGLRRVLPRGAPPFPRRRRARRADLPVPGSPLRPLRVRTRACERRWERTTT